MKQNSRLSISTEESDSPIKVSYQWWFCEKCGAKCHAILEDSHVNLSDDSLWHRGVVAEDQQWQKSLAWGLRCPDPRNSTCKCAIHQHIHPADSMGKSAWSTYE